MKKVKDLKDGDMVRTFNGYEAVIVSCEPSKIFEAAPGNGWAYEIVYRVGEDTGRVIASGEDKVNT